MSGQALMNTCFHCGKEIARGREVYLVHDAIKDYRDLSLDSRIEICAGCMESFLDRFIDYSDNKIRIIEKFILVAMSYGKDVQLLRQTFKSRRIAITYLENYLYPSKSKG